MRRATEPRLIHLTYSQRTESLFEQFARDLRACRAGQSPLTSTTLVAPNRNVESWLKRSLASRDGIAANLEVLLLRRFVASLARELPGSGWQDAAPTRFIDSDLLRALLLSVLLDERRLVSRYGAVRDVETFPDPGEELARALFERRFGLYHELAEET